MGSASLAAARQAARRPGPWRQYPSSPEGWGVKMCFRLGSFTEWWWQTTKCHCGKIHSVRTDLLKNCSHAAAQWVPLRRPTKLGSHTRGGTMLGLVRALSRHVRRFGSFTKILEDCRMMRIVCIARRWKQRLFFSFFFFFFFFTISTAFIFKLLFICLFLSLSLFHQSQ